MARIALIGAGRMGHRFAQAIQQAGHELALIFDPAPQPWAMMQEPELAPLHTQEMDDVLASDAEVYVIATTADHHVRTAEQLIVAGKTKLIIEKPLSQSVEEGEVLRAHAAAAGARIVVNHGRRYSKNTAALKALDGDPRTGTLRAVTIAMGGGSLGCVGTHWIDLCNALMDGRPETVMAMTSDTTPANNRGEQFSDPGGTTVLRYTGGRRAILDLGDDIGIVGGANFIYETGIVSWSSEGGAWTFRHRKPEDRDKALSFYGLPLVDSPFDAQPPDLIAYAQATIADILSDGPTSSGITQALDTMEVFAAIRYASRTGRTVALPLPDAEKRIVYPIP